MSSTTDQSNSFIMNSGPFLDIIPIILSYLDLKSLVYLSQTCHFWRQRIYSDIKLWPKIIELPFLGQMQIDKNKNIDDTNAIQSKLWSTLLPPEDPKALENVLNKIALSEESIQRFSLVEKVLFKNFIHTDESLRLTAFIFPSITEISFEGKLLTIDGVRHIATACKKLKHIEFYMCDNIDFSNAFRLFNTDENKQNLERIFLYVVDHSHNRVKLPNNDDLPFMVPCKRCGLYYNELKNETEKLCLYHPGEYSGYGHSCSSFSCCISMTPRYPSSLGCEYTHHEKSLDSSFLRSRGPLELHDGLPEFMFQKFQKNTIPYFFTSRRQLKECYSKWNRKQNDDYNEK